MQLLNLMARVMGTVHCIMTVAMKQHKVGNPVVCAVPILMMDFEPIICGKVEVTPPTFSRTCKVRGRIADQVNRLIGHF
jgi:hypothetical protein